MSTLTGSYSMEHRTDETIDFVDQDVVVIKNRRESDCVVHIQDYESAAGSIAVLSASRHPTYTLRARMRDTVRIRLGGGEALTIRASSWRPPHGTGPGGAPG